MEATRRNIVKDRPSVSAVDTSYNGPSGGARALVSSKSACDYKDDLLLAISPLIAILLVFGGRWSVLSASIGGTVCYILDILGSAEGTIIALIITLLSEVACMVFAAKSFLSESMYNFSVILLIWIALLFSFLICCNYFVAVARDMSVVLVVMNQLIFATLPTVAASIISWFLCVEMPSLDLLLCFNSIYFVYVLYLGRPRAVSPVSNKKSGKSSPTTPTSAPLQVLLPPYLLLMMYAVPIVVTILMHIAIHHNVLSTVHTRVTNFLLSVLIPCLLMTYCANKQIVQSNLDFHSGDSVLMENLPRFLDVSTLVLSTALVYCLESHPVMDEIKSFSDLSEDMAGYAIMAAVGLVVAAFAIHRFCWQQTALLAEQSDNLNYDGAVASTRLKLKYLSVFASLCIGGANALFAVVIGLPDHAIGVSVVGAMSLAEYYLHPDWSFASRLLLVFIAALYSALAASSFMKMTLQGIAYDFHWYIDVSMPDFTTMVNVLVPVVIALPTLVGPSARAVGVGGMGLLPGAPVGGAEDGSSGKGLAAVVLEWAFPVVCGVVCAAELMIREQDWSDIRVGVEVVYPTYYFLGMTFIVLATGVVLYAAKAIGPVCMWILCVMQGCKLLHLQGIRAMGALTTFMLVLAYTLPFIRTVTKYLRVEQEEQGLHVGPVSPRSAAKTAISTLELLFYILIASVATYWAGEHMIAHNLLQSLLSRDPTDLQQVTLCLAVWLTYLGLVLSVFYRSAKLLRNVVLVLGGLCLLIALEGFGHLNMTIERSSAAYLTVAFHPDMNVQEHPALFLFLSTALSGLAWVGIIPLNSVLMCVLYSALFGFISAKAMLGWAFPLSLADDTFTHHITAFPFLYLFASKVLLTFVAVWNPALNTRQNKGTGMFSELFAEAPLVLACAAPFFGLLWALSVRLYAQAQSGIVWSAAVGFATLCFTTRAREIYQETVVGTRTSGRLPGAVTAAAPQQVPFSACLPCAGLTVFWVSFAVFTSHGYDRDLFVPLSAVTLLCTPPGALLKGKPPLAALGAFCAVFWVLSALHAILVKGYGSDPLVVSFEKPQDYFQLDSDMSIWTNQNLRWPLLNLAQVLAPLPAVVAGLVPQFGRSEDVLFVFALISLVPVFAAHISPLRYLGVVGMLFAAAKGYRLSDQQQRSDRLI